jgi:hypothetical protein
MVVKDNPELRSGRTFFTLTLSATEEPFQLIGTRSKAAFS